MREPLLDFEGQRFGFFDGAVDQEQFRSALGSQFQSSHPSCSAGAEHQRFRIAELHSEIVVERLHDGVGIGVESMTAHFSGFWRGTQWPPLTSFIPGFKPDRVHRSPGRRRRIEDIDHRDRQ